jgi:UDP-glucose 4-epimerase
VIHLAAIVHVSKNIDAELYTKVNRDLAVETAKYAKAAGVRHFVFMSSVKVYGDESGEPSALTEKSECFPADDYGRSKLAAEIALNELNDENFCVSIIRTPVVYGVGMKANMLNLLRLVKYLPVLPLGGIDNKRQFTYIENLIGFIDRIIDLRIPGTFIAMDTDACSTTDLVRIMADALGKKVFLVKVTFLNSIFRRQTSRLFGSLIIDNRVTRRKLDFEPAYSTREGLRKMISEYQLRGIKI